STATARATVRDHAQVLMPETDVLLPGASVSSPVDTGARPRNRKPWAAEERIALAASAHPTERAGGDGSLETVEQRSRGSQPGHDGTRRDDLSAARPALRS